MLDVLVEVDACLCVHVGVVMEVSVMVVTTCCVDECLCALSCLFLCVLPVSVVVCACLCACVGWAGLGRGCVDGDEVDMEEVPAVWVASRAAVREEARAGMISAGLPWHCQCHPGTQPFVEDGCPVPGWDSR